MIARICQNIVETKIRHRKSVLKGKRYIYEGKIENFGIKSQETIESNEKLGFLRGYSFWDFLRRRVDFFISEPTRYNQEVVTHELAGGEFRRVEILVKIYDVKMKK